MVKEINVIYGEQQGKCIHYQGPEGIVWLSSQHNPNMINVFMNSDHYKIMTPNDCVLLSEPVAVRPDTYCVEHLQKFNKIFGCFSPFFENSPIKHKFVEVNYGCDLEDRNADSIRNTWKPWEERINGVVVVAGGKGSNHKDSIYHLRENLATMFHKSGMEVAWFGGMQQKRPYFKGHISNKLAEINKYRFHICIENTYSPIYSYNYMTEKLPQAVYGGTIPLYIGCYNIDEFAPKDLFIDLRKYITNKQINEQNLINAVKNYTKEDFEKQRNIAYEWMKDPNGVSYRTDMKRMYRTMLNNL